MKVPVKVKRRPTQKHWLRLLTACIGMVLLILLMFLLGKGPASIFFTSSEDTGLSGLHSQCIRLSAASVVADLSQQHLCKATTAAPEVHISSAALETWVKENLPDSCREGYLLIRNGESGISFTWEAENTTVSRWEITDTPQTDINPAVTSGFSCSASQVWLSPQVTAGSAYASSVLLDADICVTLPPEAQLVWVAQQETALSPQQLPGFVQQESGWSFSLRDSRIGISTAKGERVMFTVSGQYRLTLQSGEVRSLQGYLTGDLQFHYTNTPQTYTLADHFVAMSGKHLLLSLQTNIRCPQTQEEHLRISGEVARMNIAGINPFPNLKMWFRENTYVLPVSLLSVLISLYPPRKKQKT